MNYLLAILIGSAMVGAIILSVSVLLEIWLGVNTEKMQACGITIVLVSMILLMAGVLVYVICKSLGA